MASFLYGRKKPRDLDLIVDFIIAIFSLIKSAMIIDRLTEVYELFLMESYHCAWKKAVENVHNVASIILLADRIRSDQIARLGISFEAFSTC